MDWVDGLEPTYAEHESGSLRLGELVGLNTSSDSEWDEVEDYHEDFRSAWGDDDDPGPNDYLT